jgi:cytochrome P450
MTNLCSEIRSAFSADKDITSAQCAHLSYFSAVIEESFRLYPPVATVLLRVVPEGGDNVDGYIVPERVSDDVATLEKWRVAAHCESQTTVSTHHYASYRSAANFALPEQFIPERWLGCDERFRNDRRDVLQPFSLGPRGCIGKRQVPIPRMVFFFFQIVLTQEKPCIHRNSADSSQASIQL